jgi:hypothetical protein
MRTDDFSWWSAALEELTPDTLERVADGLGRQVSDDDVTTIMWEMACDESRRRAALPDPAAQVLAAQESFGAVDERMTDREQEI